MVNCISGAIREATFSQATPERGQIKPKYHNLDGLTLGLGLFFSFLGSLSVCQDILPLILQKDMMAQKCLECPRHILALCKGLF